MRYTFLVTTLAALFVATACAPATAPDGPSAASNPAVATSNAAPTSVPTTAAPTTPTLSPTLTTEPSPTSQPTSASTSTPQSIASPPVSGPTPTVGGQPAGTAMEDASEFDRAFIDMMVPHHEGAVDMARIAQTRTRHPEIKALAEEIVRSQATEIDQMKSWRTAWFGSDETPPMSEMPMVPGMDMGHGSGGMTMDMAADVEKLRTAPEPFDLAFINAMIPHHQSAIDAARIAERDAARPEIKELATAIITAQEREIAQMREWRESWFPESSN